MKIVPVSDGNGLKEFIEFPWTIYAGDPMWIPPLREQIFFELSGSSAFSRYGRFQLFLCEADGRPAGRIAALVNPRLTDRNGQVLGQLGYFECEDDPAIAAGLIDAGLEWLKTQGARTVVGPMNGGAHRSHRFMTRGFDREPYLFEPRNPPHYPTLFERCGFARISRWYGYELTLAQAEARVRQLDRVLLRRPPAGRIEALQTGQSQDTLVRVHRLLDRCWTGHVGYASLDLDEFAEVFTGALAIMDPGHVGAYMQDGQDAGLTFVLPDYGPEVRALEGHATGWGRWLGTSRARRLVLHTAALAPEARQGSAALAQVAWAMRCAVTGGYEDVIAALVVEGFVSTIGEQTREHALYARAIG